MTSFSDYEGAITKFKQFEESLGLQNIDLEDLLSRLKGKNTSKAQLWTVYNESKKVNIEKI